ncbi:MAG: DNA-3-methyladenine glycosylase [Parcubacteria group bacterium Gr01-1014_29]|nr:MAG: DNA-3-methyladenine glycosylase [Parcubacteria group bacterium Gr01-1014_29]
MRSRILPKEFFIRPALFVARELLGKFLVVSKNGKTISRMITEVEAYDGFRDKASHASRGKTERNAPMFSTGGIWYVYFVYGMHEMLNIVTGPKEYPAAVLLRGIEGYSGPGKLTKQLGISHVYNGLSASRKTGLWIEDRGVYIPTSRIKKSPRIGVDYAGPVWAKKRYRFFIFPRI